MLESPLPLIYWFVARVAFCRRWKRRLAEPIIRFGFALVFEAGSSTLFAKRLRCLNSYRSTIWAWNTRSWSAEKRLSKTALWRRSFCRLCCAGTQPASYLRAHKSCRWPKCNHWGHGSSPWCFWSSSDGFGAWGWGHSNRSTSRHPETTQNYFWSIGLPLALSTGTSIACSLYWLQSPTPVW